jgi:hypothetical protein
MRRGSWMTCRLLLRLPLLPRPKLFHPHKVRFFRSSFLPRVSYGKLIDVLVDTATVTEALGSAATTAQGLANQAYEAVMGAGEVKK